MTTPVPRQTRQKQAVQDVFATAGRPLSPQEVVTLAQVAVPSLGIATAYRTIKDLVESGWLVSVATAVGTRFERADIRHHHHFFCRMCSRTFDIPGCAEDIERMSPSGFVPEGHDVTITGKCDLCAKPKAKARKEPSVRS
jgi:Fur family transcriptional regulator, ferric uptake regulator